MAIITSRSSIAARNLAMTDSIARFYLFLTRSLPSIRIPGRPYPAN